MNESKIMTKPNKVIIPDDIERMATMAVDAAFAVHTELGPGLLEAAFEACFAYELEMRGITLSAPATGSIKLQGQTD